MAALDWLTQAVVAGVAGLQVVVAEQVVLALLLFATQALLNGLQAEQLLVQVTGLYTHLHLLEHWLLRLLRS
jgi:hypothetical protein